MSKEASAFTTEAILMDHELRLRALERLAWKLVGGVIVGTAIGTSVGGAVVAYLLKV